MQRSKVVPIGAGKPSVTIDRAAMQASAKALMDPMIQKLEGYSIPEEKVDRVIDFAVDLFAKHHRHMKIDRMVRKVAVEFKLKPLPAAPSDGIAEKLRAFEFANPENPSSCHTS